MFIDPPLEKWGEGGFIELEGSQHYTVERIKKDKKRDNYMMKTGITILKFSDREVLGQFDVVLEKIWSRL